MIMFYSLIQDHSGISQLATTKQDIIDLSFESIEESGEASKIQGEKSGYDISSALSSFHHNFVSTLDKTHFQKF